MMKKSEITLVEYAAFYGSLEIFQYLTFNNVDLKPSLWLYAIHGKNAEIIHLLEHNQVKPENIDECFYEAIKCSHNDIANYIQTNLVQENNSNLHEMLIKSLKYYNLAFIQNDLIKEISLHDACRYGYFFIVEDLLKKENSDINEIVKMTDGI